MSFAYLTEQDRAYLRGHKHHAKENRQRVWHLADQVYAMVHFKRPQHEIDKMLAKLKKLTEGKTAC